jgi:hypothetical protein
VGVLGFLLDVRHFGHLADSFLAQTRDQHHRQTLNLFFEVSA